MERVLGLGLGLEGGGGTIPLKIPDFHCCCLLSYILIYIETLFGWGLCMGSRAPPLVTDVKLFAGRVVVVLPTERK